MQNILLFVQLFSSIFLIVLILMQAKGTGLGRSFGGGGNVSFTRRGLEKVIFKITFVFSALFIASSLLQITV